MAVAVQPRATRPAGDTGRRPWSTASLTGLAIAAPTALVWIMVRRPVARAIGAGLTVPLFGVRVPTFNADPQAMVDRLAFLVLLLGTSVAVMSGRRRGLFRSFLLAPGSPTDLAVVRIVVFGVLAILPRVGEAVHYSRFPSALQTPPAGMPWLLRIIPASPGVVLPLALAFVLACLLACIGLWTRLAAVTAAVLGLYVLAVPQFYGKVTHYHHLWWISAVLAASRCGDALSVDAVRSSWRRGDGRSAVPGPSAAYGAPVRIVWVLIALTYLFPGAWKWVSAGPKWAFSNNLRTIMYEHWSRLEGFTPPLPVDRWPLAYMLAGLGVLIFEVTFIVLLLDRRTRAVAAVVGLMFHNMNYVFLRLGFFTLQICYVAFVPWDRLLRRIGSRLEQVEITQASGRGRRLVGSVTAVDVLGVVQLTGSGGPLTVRAGETTTQGWASVRLLSRRLPALWPLLPVSYAIPLAVGDRWLDERSEREHASPAPRRASVAVAGVGAAIIAGNALAGVGAVTAAWPFACYPTFAGVASATRADLVLVLDRPGVNRFTLDTARLRQLVSQEKLDGIARPIVRHDDDSLARARALIEIVKETGVDVPSGTRVEVERATTTLGRVPTTATSLEFTFTE